MKVFSLLSMAALTTCLTATGFCEEENPARIDFRESQNERIIAHQTSNGYGNTQDYSSSKQMMNGQNGNRVMDSKHGCVDKGFSFQGEFLWWRAIIDNLEYLATFAGTTEGGIQGAGLGFNITARYKTPEFEFSPGVRVSAGYDFGMSNWDVFARWTYHSTTANNSSSAQLAIFPIGEFYVSNSAQSLSLAEFGKAKWHNHMNVADFEMGYDYFFSDRFSFRPNFGLKAAWISMENDLSFTNLRIDSNEGGGQYITVPDVSVLNKTEWWGIGPAFGVDGNLHMGWGFSLYGRIAGSLMYGSYDTKYKETDSLGTFLEMKMDNYYRLRAMTQMVIGLEWAKCFSNDILLAFNLGWEGQYWWNQLEMHIVNDSQPRGDLTFAGLDAGIRLDF
ncbi:MAG: MOMP family protein [Chlamydiales bacterium]|nr:MOMP family protein [Chlamydiales bacterium]